MEDWALMDIHDVHYNASVEVNVAVSERETKSSGCCAMELALISVDTVKDTVSYAYKRYGVG